jgi:type IV pilus assembly protein PilW
MKKNYGFTLIELLVTMVILSIVLSAVYMTFTSTLTDYKKETKKSETDMEKGIGANLIRLDLEHIGVGLSKQLANYPIEWDNSTKTFIIRSIVNSTRISTLAWALYRCDSSTNARILLSGDNLSINDKVVFLDTSTDELEHIATTTIETNCPTGSNGKVLIAYRYGLSSETAPTNGCSTQFCNKITYILSTTQPLNSCNPNTKNLIRRIGTATTGGEPVLSCVADFKLRFFWGNSSSLQDMNISSSSITGATEKDKVNTIRDNLKRVNFYALVQKGQKDMKFNYPNNTISMDGITFNLPTGYEHYRWKILKFSVKPMGL